MLSVLRYTDSDYPFGIYKSSYGMNQSCHIKSANVLINLTFIFGIIPKGQLMRSQIAKQNQRRLQTFPQRGRGGGGKIERKIDFKTICIKKNQKIHRRNLKRELQNMVNRKMTSTKLEIFC